MENSAINTIIVNPRSARLYNYWVNNSLEKRTMLKERMREFCLELSPSNANEINRCIDEILPFVIYVNEGVFEELEEEQPEPLSKADRLLPLRKQVYTKKTKQEKSQDVISIQSKRFQALEKFNKIQKQKSSILNLFRSRTP